MTPNDNDFHRAHIQHLFPPEQPDPRLEMCWDCRGTGQIVLDECGMDYSVNCKVCDGTGQVVVEPEL